MGAHSGAGEGGAHAGRSAKQGGGGGKAGEGGTWELAAGGGGLRERWRAAACTGLEAHLTRHTFFCRRSRCSSLLAVVAPA